MERSETEHWWPVAPTPEGSVNPIHIQIEWELIEGVQQAVSVRLERPGMPLKPYEIHAVPFGRVFAEATLQATRDLPPSWSEKKKREYFEQWEAGGVRRGRPPLYGPDHWIKVAEVYWTAKANRQNIRRAIMSAFPDQCSSEATARNWVTRIKQLGLVVGSVAITEEGDTMTMYGTVTPPKSSASITPSRGPQNQQEGP